MANGRMGIALRNYESVRNLLGERSYSIHGLCDRLNISHSTVSKYVHTLHRGKKAYIAEWRVRGEMPFTRWVPCFLLGEDMPDAPRPKMKMQQMIDLGLQEELWQEGLNLPVFRDPLVSALFGGAA